MADETLYDPEVWRNLEERAIPEPNSGCLLWLITVDKDGYGQSTIKRRVGKAHRRAWIAKHGPIPPGKHVLHRCDVRSCINPAHLFLGTQKTNMADMTTKGRRAAGRSHGNAKLDENAIRAIRAAVGSCRSIGATFGIGAMTVSRIRRREAWQHVS